jgi:hypothetical protein
MSVCISQSGIRFCSRSSPLASEPQVRRTVTPLWLNSAERAAPHSVELRLTARGTCGNAQTLRGLLTAIRGLKLPVINY